MIPVFSISGRCIPASSSTSLRPASSIFSPCSTFPPKPFHLPTPTPRFLRPRRMWVSVWSKHNVRSVLYIINQHTQNETLSSPPFPLLQRTLRGDGPTLFFHHIARGTQPSPQGFRYGAQHPTLHTACHSCNARTTLSEYPLVF